MPLKDTVIMTPFNKAGFQMNPSRETCETALSSLNQEVNVIAMSTLAGGYLALDEAIDYLQSLPKLSGTIVGVSSTHHAQTTFRTFSKLLNHHDN
jgi:arginine repressor